MAAEDKNTRLKIQYSYHGRPKERLPGNMVDFIGECISNILNLLYMLWPDEKDRWVIPIAIGSGVLIIAFVALALFMQ